MTDQQSITCPKCELTSRHRGDVQSRYCRKCGFHDAPLDAPMGVPGVSAKFRQPTPAMQVQAMIMGFEGQFHNWTSGIVNNLDLRVTVERFLNDFKELYPHLESGRFLPDPNRPKPPAGGGIL